MPQTMIDVFSGDYFSSVTLTSLINQNYDYVPGLITGMNLATTEGITTLGVSFDDIAGGIRMISTTPRGAPPSQHAEVKGRTRVLYSVHMAREIQVNADELLNVRQFGTLNPQTLQNLITQRVNGPRGVKVELAGTLEHWWVGAIDGVVYDADGATVIWDYYAWTGTSRPTAVNIALSTTTSTTNLIRAAATTLKRQTILALNGLQITGAIPTVLCGDNFYDSLLNSAEIRELLKLGATGNPGVAIGLGTPNVWESFTYAGIEWINYRASTDGLISIPTNEGRFFMRGVPGLWQMFFSPADTFETVSNVGLPFYLLNNQERQTSKMVVFELQTNPLLACIRPNSLVRITKT
jgi:hypothetical protein